MKTAFGAIAGFTIAILIAETAITTLHLAGIGGFVFGAFVGLLGVSVGAWWGTLWQEGLW